MTKPTGEQLRRQVMSDEFVDKAYDNPDPFNEDIQSFINDHGWGATWNREGLDLKTRSMITVAMLCALKAPNELQGHVRGALRNGCSKEEIREIILHSGVYAGAPAVKIAYRAAKEILDTWEE